MNRKQLLLAVLGILLMVVGGGLLLMSSQQQQADKIITQAYSQIVFPANFIRVNDNAAVRAEGMRRTPIHIYAYRARGVQTDVVQQVASIFKNAGYNVSLSKTQVEGFDKTIKLTSVIGQPGSSATEQVVTITAERT